MFSVLGCGGDVEGVGGVCAVAVNVKRHKEILVRKKN